METVRRLGRACVLLARHLALLAPIVLVVWLPARVLIDVLVPAADAARRLQAAAWVELLFGPISAAGLMHALAAVAAGRAIGPGAALRAGFERAGRLLKVRLVAGVLMLLGVAALVVPGVLLMVRWALLDAVVVLEEPGIRAALARSAALTRGRRWPLLATGVLCALAAPAVSFVLELPGMLVPALDGVVLEVLVDCAADVAGTVLDVVLFLFYWEAAGAAAARRTS